VNVSSALSLLFTAAVAWASLSLAQLGAPAVGVESMPVAATAAGAAA
jgi:hypothetical protein